jgi:hypothetical protein
MLPTCFSSTSAARSERAANFASWAKEALAKLADGIRPQLIVILSDVKCPAWTASCCCARSRGLGRLAGEYGAAPFITKPIDFTAPAAAADTVGAHYDTVRG